MPKENRVYLDDDALDEWINSIRPTGQSNTTNDDAATP